MKAINPNLHLNISRKNSYVNNTNNNNSSQSIDSINNNNNNNNMNNNSYYGYSPSDLHTPVEQQSAPFNFITGTSQIANNNLTTPVFRPRTERTDSISSIMSDIELINNNNNNNNNNSDSFHSKSNGRKLSINTNNLMKTSSYSSINSSIYESPPTSSTSSNHPLSSSPLTNNSNYDFTNKFDELLLNTYYSYANNPKITPFDINYPPSGIVSQVSRKIFTSIKNNQNSSIQILNNPIENDEFLTKLEIGSILSIFRKRLLDLVNNKHNPPNSSSIKQSKKDIELNNLINISRTNSNSSINGHHKPSWLHSNPSFLTQRSSSSTDSLIDSVPLQNNSIYNNSLITPPNSSKNIINDYSLKKSSLPLLNSNIDLSNQFTFELNSNNNNSSNPITLQKLNNNNNNNNNPPLQSPFDETRFSFNKSSSKKSELNNNFEGLSISAATAIHNHNHVSDLEIDPHYNVTAQRKRDSLKLKRNMK